MTLHIRQTIYGKIGSKSRDIKTKAMPFISNSASSEDSKSILNKCSRSVGQIHIKSTN